jgi:hypothetical protein
MTFDSEPDSRAVGPRRSTAGKRRQSGLRGMQRETWLVSHRGVAPMLQEQVVAVVTSYAMLFSAVALIVAILLI